MLNRELVTILALSGFVVLQGGCCLGLADRDFYKLGFFFSHTFLSSPASNPEDHNSDEEVATRIVWFVEGKLDLYLGSRTTCGVELSL